MCVVLCLAVGKAGNGRELGGKTIKNMIGCRLD